MLAVQEKQGLVNVLLLPVSLLSHIEQILNSEYFWKFLSLLRFCIQNDL